MKFTNRKAKEEVVNSGPLYGGILPYPSQWVTVFAIALEDIGALLKEMSGLNPTQARFLYEISYERSTNSTSEISRVLQLRPNTSSAVIHHLVSWGLIEQSCNPNDRRVTTLKVTELGQNTVKSIDSALEVYSSLLRSALNKEQLMNLHAIGNYGAEKLGSLYQHGKKPLAVQNYFSTVALILTNITAAAKQEGLSLIELRILAAIVTMQTPPRLTTLSARLGLRANVVSMAANRLEKLGLIRRQQDPKDHRALRLFLTDRGIELFGKAVATYVKTMTIDPSILKTVPVPITARLYNKRPGLISIPK
ncbi:MAG: MarR family transcriptional regulator [Actinobacteria bacterium]|nr:MarR family transcriptional regulator [Actinomycetota bacterium]